MSSPVVSELIVTRCAPTTWRSGSRSSVLAFCWLALVWNGATSWGGEWTSPDGVIKVTVPEAPQFEPVEMPPPTFLALWISADETLRLGVVQVPLPTGERIDRSRTDQALGDDFQGTITATTSSTSNDHEVWTTSAHGSHAGAKVRVTQAIVRVPGSAYKIMAMTIGEGPLDEATIQPFLQSIQVTGPPHPGGIAGSSSGKAPMTSDEFMQNVSYNLGRATGMVLMILLVVWVVSLFNKKTRRRNPTSQSSPGPPTL